MLPIHVQAQRLRFDAVLPSYATAGDAGLDLSSCGPHRIASGERAVISTGIALAIPEGHVGLIHPRSGLAARAGITVLNAPGTIDSGYRGEIKVILLNTSNEPFMIAGGDRIAQLVIQEYRHAELLEVDELPQSHRGSRGFGSTGV
tara:strand:+ start:66716 stop:67153 length:438 start_codon:yes stop_codon:yes gene_type:complete